MANKQQLKRLHAIHRAQVKLFRRTSAAIECEFKREAVCANFLSQTKALTAEVNRQIGAAEKLLAYADSLPSAPATANSTNRSVIVIESLYGGKHGVSVFDYLDAMRKATLLIAEQDMNNFALVAYAKLRKQANANADDKELKDRVDAMSWRLVSCQGQLDSLKRQAEAICATEQALLRFRGLKFWQGRKNHLRWEGDMLSQ